MQTEKEDIKIEKIVNLLKNSEDDGTFLDSLYDLYLFVGIAKGIDDAKNGRGMSLEDFKAEREVLYENYSRRFG